MKEKQEEKKLIIIKEGLKVLYRKGYNATGVKEITDAAGIPKGSFYNYFSSKEDFAVAAMQYFTSRELAVMEEILTDTQTPPLERIENLYRMKIEHFISKGRYSFGCFLCNITLEMADISEMIAAEASKAFDQEYQPIINCLQEAKDRGDLPQESDIHLKAETLRNSWFGALVIMKANKNEKSLLSFQQSLRDLILR
ncbi:TetR/AcrR family transcriptional regulator [Desulfogranum japonicum]|uniref:TetR/AcrR family transcriptional regulator n=1 Tax=Desulfogranum japonicum TaxID=231447 RepID=UPI00042936D7|nr:TetR/AcrR family transcriptional regulator [Desulfogranum japonicum]